MQVCSSGSLSVVRMLRSIERMLAFDSRTGSKLSSLLHYPYGRFARSWQLPACFTCYVRTDASVRSRTVRVQGKLDSTSRHLVGRWAG